MAKNAADQGIILTFDQGTTRSKVALFTMKGTCLGQVAARNEEFSTEVHAWQSAGSWWKNAIKLARELIGQDGINTAGISAISVSGRASAGIFLDDRNEIVYEPWLDLRHRSCLKRIRAEYAALPLYAATLLAKLIWIRENDAPGFARITHALYAKDFLVYQLTGEAITDPSSGPDALNWPAAPLQQLGIDEVLLPRPQLPWSIAAELKSEVADLLGVKRGIPVVVGAHDGICANTGAGAIQTGQYALTLGTHGVTRTVIDAQPEAHITRFYGFPPDRHVVGANAIMAGRSLDWFLDQWFDPSSDRQALFRQFDAGVAGANPGAAGVSFLPYLSGQISPVRNPGARATFHGLSINHDRQDMYQAVLEGASFAIAESFRQLVSWTGPPASVHVTGSGANSRVWVQLLADVLGVGLQVTDSVSEGRGAAIFAAVAIGEYASVDEAIRQMVHVSETIEPVIQNAAVYRDLFSRWQELGLALRGFDAQGATETADTQAPGH